MSALTRQTASAAATASASGCVARMRTAHASSSRLIGFRTIHATSQVFADPRSDPGQSSSSGPGPTTPSSTSSASGLGSGEGDDSRPPTRWFLTPKKYLPPTPIKVSQPPQFPAPNDPFTQPSTTPKAGAATADGSALPPVPVTSAARGQYSDTTKAVVRGVARLMGYNSKASTAIRETKRMMRGVVESIERDRVYWYEECGLPPTYQTFFQLHLLYILILLPRLRAITASAQSQQHAIPEPLDPSPPSPHYPQPDIAQSTTSSAPTEPPSSPSSSSAPVLGKPENELYPSELLNHFFELAESEMRKVLGRGERERVVKKYMDEMGEQWKGAGTGLDYVLGLGQSDVQGDKEKADVELASWVWRNLFASQGLVTGPAVPEVEGDGIREAQMVQRLEEVVRFVRREMARLDRIDDEDVLDANIGEWGSPRQDE